MGETWKERVKVLTLCKSNFDENGRMTEHINSTQYGQSTASWRFAFLYLWVMLHSDGIEQKEDGTGQTNKRSDGKVKTLPSSVTLTAAP